MFFARSFLVLVSLFVVACSSSAPAHETVKSLEGTSWGVVSIEGMAVVPGTMMTVQFGADGNMNGNTGCNQFLATYAGESAMIRFELTGASKKLCHEPNGVMDQESRFLAILGVVASFESSGDQLVFVNPDGGAALTLQASVDGQ